MRFGIRAAIAAIAAATMLVGGSVLAGPAAAIPRSVEPDLVTTLRCDTRDPWPGPMMHTFVDVFTNVANPSDGLPGPVIDLIATNPRPQGGTQGFLEYTVQTTVTWHNRTTNATGRVVVPTRARAATWEVNIHPGRGDVDFTIHQKVGAMLVVPMVNPQYSTCSGRARVV